MSFILSSMFLEKLRGLEKEYERRTGVDLKKDPKPWFVSCFFGSKDIATRKTQFAFLNDVYNEVQSYLHYDHPTKITEQERQACIISLRILLTSCLYVKSQIMNSYSVKSPNSILLTLIDEALGISISNPLDDHTKKLCVESSQKWINLGLKLGQDPLYKAFNYLGEKDTNGFKAFLEKESNTLSAETSATYFPIANTLRPLVRAPFALAGTQIGWVLGGALAETNVATSIVITTMASGYIISILPVTYVGAIILVPNITARVLNTFYGVSFSWVAGNGLGLVGEGFGFTLGMSLDLSLLVLKSAYHTMGAVLRQNQLLTPPPLGLRLTDGRIMQFGIEMDVLESITFIDTKSHRLPTRALLEPRSQPLIELIEDEEEEDESWVLMSRESVATR